MQSVLEGPADEGRTYSVSISRLGSFQGYEGKCSRGKWSEIQNVNCCDINPTEYRAGEENNVIR